MRRKDFYGFQKFEFVPLDVSGHSSSLTEEERQLIDETVEFVIGKTAKEISELSHKLAWQLARMGEELPYFTVFGWQPADVTEHDIEWARSTIRGLPPRDSVAWSE